MSDLNKKAMEEYGWSLAAARQRLQHTGKVNKIEIERTHQGTRILAHILGEPEALVLGTIEQYSKEEMGNPPEWAIGDDKIHVTDLGNFAQEMTAIAAIVMRYAIEGKPKANQDYF